MGDGEVNKVLWLVVGVVVFVTVAGLVFFGVTRAKGAFTKAFGEVEKTNTAMLESKYTDYDGDVVLGSEVISCINNWSTDYICVIVDGTKFIYDGQSNANGFDLSDTKLSTKPVSSRQAANGTSTIYISPSAQYVGAVYRTTDGTNEVSCVEFTIMP